MGSKEDKLMVCQPGKVAHSHDPVLRRIRQEDPKFKVNLLNVSGSALKQSVPIMSSKCQIKNKYLYVKKKKDQW